MVRHFRKVFFEKADYRTIGEGPVPALKVNAGMGAVTSLNEERPAKC
jgi:hypothetical protein